MFAHLAARTSYSLRDGVIRPRELAVAARQLGMDAVGIADRGGLYGAVRFAEACKLVAIRPIYGADLALEPDCARPGWGIARGGRGAMGRQFAGPGSGPAWLEDDAARVTLTARTQAGHANLCRTITDHHLESARSDPHVTWDQLTRRTDGVYALLGDDSPVGRLLDAGRPDAAAAEARRWVEAYGPDAVLVGVTHHLAKGDDARARRRFALADRLGLRPVAHQAPRYLRPADALVADVMDAVRQQVPLDPRHSSRRNAEGYFKSPAAMAAVFAERPDAIANAARVAETCEVDLGLGRLRVPDFVALGATADAQLRGRCESGIRERYPNPGHAHWDLLERELAMVAQLRLAPYFLTVAEIMGRIREKGVLSACRGSAAGSVITYALRISDVDPIAHDLAFERFMNPYRDDLPDIDIDVESSRREDIYTDLLDRYGTDRVACVCMVERFKARMAIREVGKALGLPANEVDYIAKSFPHVAAGDVRPAMEHLPELRRLNLDAGQLDLLFDVVERLDNFPRHLALHPSGVLLADATLRDFVPLERSFNGFAMAQFDKDDVEALGLCKLDILSVRMLSSMTHATEETMRVRGETIDFDAVPWDDPGTYELIQSTRTLGCFQIESPGQRELVGKFQPEHLDDLVVDISLFRPGPVKGDMVGPFLQRRLGQAKTVYPHPILERALGETFGVIVYHEQVMRCIAAVTGCDLSMADLARRRLGDPEQLDELYAWVLTSARERGMPDDITESLWTALTQFASFGFCKAHAAAFAVPTYRSAWLKAHYMPEFVAGLLTHDPGMYPRRLILDDARQFGIAVLGLDVNRSGRDYRVERVRADHAYRLLGLPASISASGKPLLIGSDRDRARPLSGAVGQPHLPPGWRWDGQGPVPPAGFDRGAAEPGWRFAVRLALQDVAHIDDRMIDSLLAGRPFASVEDLRRRSALSAPVAEALAHVGALDELAGVASPSSAARGAAGSRTRRDVLLEVSERWSGVARHRPSDPSRPEQLGLLPRAADPSGLSDYRPSECVRAELEVLGMDASAHVIRFYDDLLDVLGVTRASNLLECRNGQRVRLAGVKVATQTPPVKSGQRVIFLSLDDATGVSDAAFFESVHDRCAWTVFHTWLLVVDGVVRRAGRRGVSLNATAAWDMRRLMRAWQQGWLDEALKEQGATGAQAARNFSDQAPAGIHGAPGRSGLALGGGGGQPFGGRGPGAAAQQFHDTRQVNAELQRAAGTPGARSPAARLRMPRNDPYGAVAGSGSDVGAPSRTGPNGTTWADPARRHPGVDHQDVYRLPRSHPAHPKHIPPELSQRQDEGEESEPPRKLWHSSGGSAGG